VKPQTLVELLSGRAQQFENKQAFSFVRTQHGDVVSITYGQLHAHAMAIAAELQIRTRPGDRAWLLFPPGLESIAAFFGCLYAGVVAVPLSPPRTRRLSGSLQAVFDASEPALVLTSSEHLEQAASLYGELPQLQNLPWLATDGIPDDQRVQWRDPNIGRGDLAFLQYTSGSTAAPKGVMLSHENLIHNSSLIREAFGTDEDSTAVFWLPLYHDMGLIGGVIQPIYCGGTCVLLAPAAFLQRPRLWLETISSHRASISGGPDFAYDVCARKIGPEDRDGLDLSCWRLAFTGAEPIRAGTLDRFASAFAECGFRREAFLPVYGLAEATLMVSGGPRGNPPTVVRVDAANLGEHRICEVDEPQSAVRDLVGSGTCLPGQRVVIVDPNTSRPCREDEVGEIWVRGASVAQGYFRQSEATNSIFHGFLADADDEEPYLRTGDLGFLRHGQLFVTGRLKDLIIIRGRNYYPEDIELTVEAAHPSFRAGHCVAFSAEIEEQERLVVVQEIEPRNRSVDSQAAFQAIRQAISAAHEVEAYSIVLAKAGAIPKTTSGKRRRTTCRDLFLEGGLEMHANWTARGRNGQPHPMISAPAEPVRQPTAKEIEVWLVQRIALRLSVTTSQIQLERPFFELGMGSLDAVEITSDLERWLNRQLIPTAIYNYPNISSLANWLATSARASEDPNATSLPQAGAFSASQMLREIQQMSQEEIEASIGQELANQR
jgi:acyl-CoA synthetase (AMP-forming)/AMP-acid ligase II/acyl carrier protein